MFSRIDALPVYAFARLDALKAQARRDGVDVIDLGMGNPDGPTPPHIVEKLVEAVRRPHTHGYSASRGVRRLREKICEWYAKRLGVELDPEREAIATIGSKEGIGHFFLAATGPGDTVAVPDPAYPIHFFAPHLAGARVLRLPAEGDACLEALEAFFADGQRIDVLLLNFPQNPSTACVGADFFARVLLLAEKHDFFVVHDYAYADLVFDGYRAPSVLEVPEAKSRAAEFFTLSKSYNMAGWRVGFMVGCEKLISALARLQSYYGYGHFTPVQVAAIAALEGPQDCVAEIRETYRRRRDALCAGLSSIGWEIPPPKATMFLWARIPENYAHLGSQGFAEKLLQEAGVAVSAGVGFGERGEGFVRMALIENEMRLRQAVRQIKTMFAQDSDKKCKRRSG